MRREDGQSLVLVALLMPVICLFAALVIDTGYWMVVKRNLQGDADAAALAAVRDLPGSQSAAAATAREYVEQRNADDAADLASIDIQSARITVNVERETPGAFMAMFGQTPTIRAVAAAQTLQLQSAVGMLPLALMRDSYTVGSEIDIKTDGSSSNHGPIAPDHGPPSCPASSGSSDYRQLLTGPFGGLPACEYDFGDIVPTQTGNVSGPTRQGLDSRMGSNSDSFDDVFELDSATGVYTLVKPDSPRVGLIPVVENMNGSSTWPSGTAQLRIVSYVLVYIGKTSNSGNPAYTNNGKDVWVTPVRAALPSDYDATFGDNFDSDAGLPVTYRLVD